MFTHRMIRLIAVTAFIGSLASAARAQHVQSVSPATTPQIQYTVTDLGTLTPGALSVAESVNASGAAAGISAADAHYRAALFQGGLAIELAPVGGDDSEAYGINDRGAVVGETEIDEVHPTYGQNLTRGFIWLPEPAYGLSAGMHEIGTLGGFYSIANEINNAGQVVGGASALLPDGDMPFRAFLWEAGSMSNLGTLGGWSSQAQAINSSGQVAGSSQIADTNEYHAFLWATGAGMIDLGTLGGDQSFAFDINDAGAVVGYSETGELTGLSGTFAVQRAVMWRDGQLTRLGTLPIGPLPGGPYGPDNIHSNATGINNFGVVVGHSFPNGGAWVWRNGTLRNLNELIPANSQWFLRYAKAINDAGQIVGVGTFNGMTRAFLLTPAIRHTKF